MKKFIKIEHIPGITWNESIHYGNSESGFWLFDKVENELQFFNSSYNQKKKFKLDKELKDIFILEENILGIGKDGTRLGLWEIDDNSEVRVIAKTDIKSDSCIVSAELVGDKLVLLDKNYSLIRVYDKELNDIKTVGSRLGYFRDYSYIGRIGFEMPEDLVKIASELLIADSGNNRIVVLSESFQPVKAVILPEAPYKILFYNGDIGGVLDYKNTIMLFSVNEGFLGSYDLDFMPDVYNMKSIGGVRCIVASEEGVFCSVKSAVMNKEELIREGGQSIAWLRFLLNSNVDAAAEYASDKGGEVLLEYLKNGGKWGLTGEVAKDYIMKSTSKAFKTVDTTLLELFKECHDFIVMYKSVPSYGDEEAAHIAKERIGARGIAKIKSIRGAFDSLALYNKLSGNCGLDFEKEFSRMFAGKFDCYSEDYKEYKDLIEKSLENLQEETLVKALAGFWIMREMMRTVFTDQRVEFDPAIPDEYLFTILRNFYYNLALIFYKKGKYKQFIFFCEKELEMYVEKESIFVEYIKRLILIKEYDRALELFERKPVQDKQNMNFLLSRIYKEKGDHNRAFKHLKRELDLFVHRHELLPELIKYNKMNREDVTHCIDSLMNSSVNDIDANLNIAKAFLSIGDFKNMDLFLDRELELYPENERAVSVKIERLIDSKAGKDEIKRLVDNIEETAADSELVKAAAYFYLEEYRQSFSSFSKFVVNSKQEGKVRLSLYLLGSLNYLEYNTDLREELDKLKEECSHQAVIRDIDLFIEFTENHKKAVTFDEVMQYAEMKYLVSNSCDELAFAYLYNEAEALIRNGNSERVLIILEELLRYMPGNSKVFGLLDKLL